MAFARSRSPSGSATRDSTMSSRSPAASTTGPAPSTLRFPVTNTSELRNTSSRPSRRRAERLLYLPPCHSAAQRRNPLLLAHHRDGWEVQRSIHNQNRVSGLRLSNSCQAPAAYEIPPTTPHSTTYEMQIN